MRFLLTRPAPDCARSAARLRALGHEAVEAPMLKMVATDPGALDLAGVSAVTVTSGRVAGLLANRSDLSALLELPVYTVGNRSAEAMRAAGFDRVLSANGDFADLVNLILDEAPSGRVLYLAAADRAGDLEGHLHRGSVACDLVEVYRMDPVRDLEPAVLEVLKSGDLDALLLYSRRTAEALLSVLADHELMGLLSSLRVIAISQQVASALPDTACVEVAAHPTEEALFAQALTGC
ncbi:uroporphyrinogen-III synthase [uncultured Roseibium sp.]|uniref:uroporphyrinogen-III synthase n=1 Tax=uncultured Roseibium sp. TaxID=1936171 RepID=UPI00259A2FBB|nr:uroporphyrinogen-III synthase [uncultured Roseibium sp.]